MLLFYALCFKMFLSIIIKNKMFCFAGINFKAFILKFV